MAVPTRSNSRRNGRAWAAVLLGLLSIAAIPAAVVVTRYTKFTLIQAGAGIPVAFLLGLLALYLGGSARLRTERTIGRVGSVRATGWGRRLGGVGVYVSLTGALALGVYELLKYLTG
jgi:hypothetical protein